MQMSCYVNGMAVTLPGDGFIDIDGLPSHKNAKVCARKAVVRVLYKAFVDGSNPDDAGVNDISVRFNCSEYKQNDGAWVKPNGDEMPKDYIEPVERFLRNQVTAIASKYIKTNTKKVQV